MNISGSPIGIFLAPFKDVGQMPAQAGGSGIEVVIDVFPQHKAMLNELKEFHHVIVLCQLLERAGKGHVVTPFLDTERHGIFNSESAKYPNPIGFSVMRLKGILGSLMIVQGIDVLDQTPVFDIKPCIADFDMCDVDRFGWFEKKFYQQKQPDYHAE